MAVDDVALEVEYCGTCGGYANKYSELKGNVLNRFPNMKINGIEGRRASFEVKINGTLVHSKLSTLTWPDNDDLNNIINEVSEGREVRLSAARPMFNCMIL